MLLHSTQSRNGTFGSLTAFVNFHAPRNKVTQLRETCPKRYLSRNLPFFLVGSLGRRVVKVTAEDSFAREGCGVAVKGVEWRLGILGAWVLFFLEFFLLFVICFV